MTRPITECPLWRWMPGMRLAGDARMVASVVDGEPYAYWQNGMRPCLSPVAGGSPDPNDPATVGCLLALVREAWGIPGLGVHCDRNGTAGGWVVGDGAGKPGALRKVFAPTEWDALCAALWAASDGLRTGEGA